MMPESFYACVFNYTRFETMRLKCMRSPVEQRGKMIKQCGKLAKQCGKLAKQCCKLVKQCCQLGMQR